MNKVTEPFPVTERATIPGLPYYIYNRVVSDVESTAAAATALAEATRHGLLPKETPRVSIRGKKVQETEKADATIRLAAEKLAAQVGEDGGISGLVRQAVNTGFDKSKFPYNDVPFKGKHPPLIDVQTACSCANGLAALEALAGLDEKAAASSAAARERARSRVLAIAERWYRETSPDFRKAWADVYASFTVSKEDLMKSAELPLRAATSPPVAELPWGGVGARYAIVPALLGACRGSGSKLLDDPLYRQIAYRLVNLQDANGQWQGVSYDLLSSARNALAIAQVANSLHKGLNHVPQQVPRVVPTPYSYLLQVSRSSHPATLDNAAQPTLASLVFLVASTDAPVDLAGIPILPEPVAQEPPPADGKPAKPQLPPTVRAATGIGRPNLALPTLAAGVVAGFAAPTATTTAADTESTGNDPPADEEADSELGTIDDLLKPKSP